MQTDGWADMAQQIGPSFSTLHIPARFIVSEMTVHTEENKQLLCFFLSLAVYSPAINVV
jgi:hypothetical protein